jgi:hypothetical protein
MMEKRDLTRAVSKFFSGIQKIPGAVLGAILGAVAANSQVIGVTSLGVLALIVLAGSVVGFSVGGLLGVIFSGRKTNNGIVPVGDLHKPRRLPGENFAAELLTEDIRLDRMDNGLRVTVSRKNVKEAVISSAGKESLADMHVGQDAPVLLEADNRILEYMLGRGNNNPSPVDLRTLTQNGIRLRWASGGMLSIVNFRRRRWIPLFFRDIRPYGWNISLGSSERHFNKLQLATNRLDEELNDPACVIGREFLEETLVLENAFRDNVNSYNQKTFVVPGAGDANVQNAKQLNAKHVTCRAATDNLFFTHQGSIINARPAAPSMTLVIEDVNGGIHTVPHVLVCINLLELGIEVVKVMEYDLDENDYLLDGEILEIHKGNGTISTELTRMPVALVSCDFLGEQFGAGALGNDLGYTLGGQPSVNIHRNIPAEHIHLFDWDVRRRIQVMLGSNPAEKSERKRYLDWFDKFGSCFVDERGNPVHDRAPGLFTPTTVKILKLYFNGGHGAGEKKG